MAVHIRNESGKVLICSCPARGYIGWVLDQTFDIEALEIHVLASDPGPDPTTFVLVHGIGVAASYFRPLAEELSRHGRVIAVSLPGFGPTKDPDRTVRISQYARVTREAVTRVGAGQAVWVGHSMGTQVVVEAVAQDPTIASRVVLLSPVVNRAERGALTLARRFTRSAARESVPSAMASVKALLGGGLGSFFRAFPIMLAYPIEERICAIDVPTLLVTGELDETAPRYWLDELAEACPGETHVDVVGHASHQAMYTRPAVVADLIVKG